MPAHDVIHDLLEVSFDGLPSVPCSAAGFTFRHTQAPRKYPYVDGEGHDHTGREAIPLPVTLHFINTLSLEQPGVVLFPDVYEAWMERLLDGKPALLDHPLRGTVNARVLEGTVELAATSTAGVTVNATFVESLDDPTETTESAGTGVSLAEAEAIAEANASAVGVSYPTGELELGLGDSIASVSGQITSGINSATGQLNQVTSNVEGMIEDCEAIGSAAYAATDALTAVWEGLKTLAEHAPVQLQQSIGSGTTASDTTLDQIAGDTGNKLSDIIGLNPTLLRLPTVPRGTSYKFYTGSLKPTLKFST
jgi:prophage DNA circulation protein